MIRSVNTVKLTKTYIESKISQELIVSKYLDIPIDVFSLCLSLPLDYNLPNGKARPLTIPSTLCLAHKCLLI